MPELTISPKLTLHYQDYNPAAEEPIILLHGLGVTADSWQMQVSPLVEAGFHVLVPDAPGFGSSTYPGGSMSIAGMAEPIASLMKARFSKPASVVGISMGGTLALQLALDHPEQVKRLVLVNTFARLDISKPSSWLYFASRFVLVHVLGIEAQAKFVAKRLFPGAGQEMLRQALIAQVVQADPAGYRSAMRALARFNVLDRLSALRCPTLIVTGENDTTVPPKNQLPLVQQIPGARQVILPNAGHALSVESPEAFNRLLLSFVRQQVENPEAGH